MIPFNGLRERKSYRNKEETIEIRSESWEKSQLHRKAVLELYYNFIDCFHRKPVIIPRNSCSTQLFGRCWCNKEKTDFGDYAEM
jgi:hypothetical protein